MHASPEQLSPVVARPSVPAGSVVLATLAVPFDPAGERMAIDHTRAMVRAAIDGSLAGVPVRRDPIFDVEVPIRCPDVPDAFLDPRGTWADPAASS